MPDLLEFSYLHHGLLVLYLERPPRNSPQSHDLWPGASDTAT